MKAIAAIRKLASKNAKTGLVKIEPDMAAAVKLLTELIGPPPPPGHGIVRKNLPLQVFVAEVCFASVNFCYWEERSGNRPAGGSSATRSAVFGAFGLSPYPDETELSATDISEDCLIGSVRLLAKITARDPIRFATKRGEFIAEIGTAWSSLMAIYDDCLAGKLTEESVDQLIKSAPGFRDEFGKRALLFFMLLYRIYGQAGEIVALLPLPSDYQVPKVLRECGVLRYSRSLAKKVDGDTELSKGGKEERAIRGSAIVACERLAVYLNITEEAVDDWLWSSRKKCRSKHHLTATTDY